MNKLWARPQLLATPWFLAELVRAHRCGCSIKVRSESVKSASANAWNCGFLLARTWCAAAHQASEELPRTVSARVAQVRLSQLEGMTLEIYSTTVLPPVLEQAPLATHAEHARQPGANTAAPPTRR